MNETVEVEYLNLLTDEGLRSVPLDSVGRIKLVESQARRRAAAGADGAGAGASRPTRRPSR